LVLLQIGRQHKVFSENADLLSQNSLGVGAAHQQNGVSGTPTGTLRSPLSELPDRRFNRAHAIMQRALTVTKTLFVDDVSAISKAASNLKCNTLPRVRCTDAKKNVPTAST
jgi:hypothetical protein